jgi:hypothetical protein
VLSLLFASLSNNFPSDLLFAKISSSLCRGSSGSFFVLIFLNIPEGLSLGDLSGGEPRALDNIFDERIENLLLLWGTGELGSSDLRESSMLNFASLWELPLSTAVGSRTNGSSWSSPSFIDPMLSELLLRVGGLVENVRGREMSELTLLDKRGWRGTGCVMSCPRRREIKVRFSPNQSQICCRYLFTFVSLNVKARAHTWHTISVMCVIHSWQYP